MMASDRDPTSFKTRTPGESVRIRGSSGLGAWSANTTDQFVSQLPLTVEILGNYWLKDAPTSSRYDPIVSETGIEVEIAN